MYTTYNSTSFLVLRYKYIPFPLSPRITSSFYMCDRWFDLMYMYVLGNSQVIDQGHIYVTPIKPRQGHGVVVWTAIGGNGA